MKKITLLLFIVVSSFGINAQVTKSDVEAMLADQGSSMDKITELYVTNRVVHYTDGSWKIKDATYESDNHNKFELTESGIRSVYNPPDKDGLILLFPFKSMKYISISPNSISIHLKN